MHIQKIKNSAGFTFVELIVVVVILVILGSVGFSAYTGYIDWARDANRLASLEKIRSGLQTYLVDSSSWLPLPTDSVEIKSGSQTIGYQGYAGQEVLDAIDFQKWGKDPLDDSFYTYYVSESRNKFQLLGFLEEQENLQVFDSRLFRTSYAIDYASRFPTVTGQSLWILVWDGIHENVPLQEIATVQTATELDIASTTETFTAIIDNQEQVTWDSEQLAIVESLDKTGWYIGTSCKDILENSSGVLWKNGSYFINSDWTEPYEVQCDMTIDWGGRTLYSAKNIYWFPSDWNITPNQKLQENLDFDEYLWIFTSPSWTVASFTYKFYNKTEAKRAFETVNTSYDNALWWQDASIHYPSKEALANAVEITAYDTTWISTQELRSYIKQTNRNYFSWWVRASSNEVWLFHMSSMFYYHTPVRNNYLWLPYSGYTNTTSKTWWESFTTITTWNDSRNWSSWVR